jgi:maltose/moltooligosaccharide transporter
MSEALEPDHPQGQAKGIAAGRTYHVGTLTYTRATLAVLFFWLLWGDFCYVVMETVAPSILPLKFKSLGASNTAIGIILTTVPWAINFCLNPIISFKSDRFRSRWGRRIPFIAFSLPFLVVCLCGLGFGDKIGFWIHGHLGLAKVHPNIVALGVLSALLIVFSMFNSFVNSTFWYLFNDVMPEHLLARFMSWFRVVSMVASAVYNFYVFQFAMSHTAAIFIGAALVYLSGFSLMCWNVQEGQYPPPPPYTGGTTGPLAAAVTFGRECHSHPLYWCQFLITFLGSVGNGAAGFAVFYSTISLGLSLEQVGVINGWQTVSIGVLILGSGWLADKFHPIRVVVVSVFLGVLIQIPSGFIWLFWRPSTHVIYGVMLGINILIVAPITALNGVWDPPLLMRMFPRSRFGQFCSANAMWRAGGAILGASLAGMFLDLMTKVVGETRSYLYIPFWQLAFNLPVLILVVLLYRNWQRCGGDDAYVAPLPKDLMVADVAAMEAATGLAAVPASEPLE